MPLTAAAATAIVGGISALANGASQYFTAKKNNADAKKLANESYEKSRLDYMMDRAHQEYYDSPEHQKLLARVAGMNENDYVADSNAQAAAPQGGAPDLSPVGAMGGGLPDISSGTLEALNQIVKIKNTLSDTKKADAETNQINSLLGGTIENLQLKNDVLAQDIESAIVARQEAVSRMDLNRTQKEKVEREIRELKDTFELRKVSLDLDNQLKAESVDLAELDKKMKGFELDKMMPAKLANIVSQTELNGANTQLSKANYIVACQYASNLAQEFKLLGQQESLNEESLKQALIHTGVLDATKAAQVDKQIAEAKMSEKESKAFWWKFGMQAVESVSNVVKNGAMAYGAIHGFGMSAPSINLSAPQSPISYRNTPTIDLNNLRY